MGCVQRKRGPLPGSAGDRELTAGALERRLRDHFDEQNYAVSILMPKKSGEAPGSVVE